MRDGIPLQSGGTDGIELLYICRFWSEGIPLHSGGNVVMALSCMYLAKWQPVKLSAAMMQLMWSCMRRQLDLPGGGGGGGGLTKF